MSAQGVTVLTKTKHQSKDSPKTHEWSQKKVLSHEAECISSILKNCICQVEIAATLPAVLRLNSTSSIVNKELSQTIKEHQILNGRLETLDGLKQMSDREQEREVQKARAQLEKDIKNSVRDLLRVARAYADVISGWRAELRMQVGESECMLIQGLEKFHSHVVEKLLATPDEELQNMLQKQEALYTTHDLDEEEEVAATAMKQIDAKISEVDDEIKNLQQAPTENRQESLSESHIKLSKIKQTSIEQEIEQVNGQLNALILANRQVEREIQEKNEKLEAEIEYVLQMFDNEIEETQSNLDLNEADYEREEEELRKLEKSFSTIKTECEQIEEKRRLAEEKRREEMRELQLKTRAAIIAQAWWRGYSTRKALKNKSKSKKAKKGGKTKKK